MKTVQLKTAPELKNLINAVEKYRKRNCFLKVQTEVTLHGTYWDGGSRSTYTAVDLATGRKATAAQFDPPQFGGPSQAPTVAIPDGIAIVETEVFCGKTATATVYLHPNNATKFLE